MQGFRSSTRVLASILAGSILVLAGSAAAREVAPRPVDPGEWYFGATAGYEEFDGPEYKSLRVYKNDSAFTPSGDVTVDNPQGWLLEKRLSSREFVPQVHFGYGFERQASEDFLFRVELNLEGWNRDVKKSESVLSAPDSGFTVEGTDVGGAVLMVPIDGKDNDDDTDPAFFFTDLVDFEDVSLEIEEFSRGGDLTLYFDDRIGRLVYSHGLSVVYNYTYQKTDLEYFVRDLIGVTGVTTEEDARYEQKFRTRTHTMGGRVQYSVGYAFLPNMSVFTTGRVGLFARYSRYKGTQKAPCLESCDVGTNVFIPGTRKISRDDWKFAYDAQMGVGMSVRVFFLRLTAHGGGTRIGRWVSPRETDDDGVDLGKSDGWGYFANATATLIF